ncbi:MAG: rhodanese-like domain-containing protein [Marinobacterium sp.]|nr:rhodanese-like domain-containing protein [Marinobacterium sp.]
MPALMLAMACTAPVQASDTSRVMIAPGLYSFVVEHNGKPIEVRRSQQQDHQIHRLYTLTSRGTPQPMQPFKPYPVETLGEREMAWYMIKAQQDDSIMLIDTRTEGWHQRLTIPGAINLPWTLMDNPEHRQQTLQQLGVRQHSKQADFSQARTLVLFCNGPWCDQTPTMVRHLLKQGYPAQKLKYYRGGMQAWASLGLTVVGDAADAVNH